jgi:hypothetical protein
MALARLCLRQAGTARTPAAADELRRLAKEYEDRAASLGEGESLPSNAQPSSHVAQQQQQSQAEPEPVVPAAAIGLRDDAAHWREHAERLRTPLLKLGKVAKPGHFPDRSTIHPCTTPNPASRSAILNSSEVICDFFLKGFMCNAPHAGSRASTRATCIARHSPTPRGVGTARLLSAFAMPFLLVGRPAVP